MKDWEVLVLAIRGLKYPIDIQEVCDKFKQ